MAGSFFDRHFVRWSSRDSIAAEKISLLAVAEVIFSVAAYWWIAWYFDTYAHLLVSVIVAPLVLLRSDESVALGVEMFSRYLRARSVPLRSAKGVSLLFVSATAAGGAGWLAADWFLIGHEGWPLFWRSVLIGLFAMNVGLAATVAGAVAGATAVAAAVVGERAVAITIAVAIAIAVAGALAGEGEGPGAVAVAVAGVGAVAVALAGSQAIAQAAKLVTLGLGFNAGFLIRIVATRLYASLRHILRGVAAFPKNWWRTLFQIDLLRAPELVPGIGEEHPKLEFGGMIEDFFSESTVRKILFAIFVPILFAPSLLYRYSIKSTCWLYLPLIYVAYLPGELRDKEKQEAWLQGHTRKVLSWASLFGAVVALLAAVVAYTDYTELTDLVSAVQRGNLQATPLAYLLVLDFSNLPIWHRFSLPASVLTVGLFFALNNLAVDLQTGAKVDVSGLRVRALIWLSRLRNLLVFCWVVITVYYFAEFAYGQCRLWDWMTPLLEWRFGPAPACPAPGN